MEITYSLGNCLYVHRWYELGRQHKLGLTLFLSLFFFLLFPFSLPSFPTSLPPPPPQKKKKNNNNNNNSWLPSQFVIGQMLFVIPTLKLFLFLFHLELVEFSPSEIGLCAQLTSLFVVVLCCCLMLSYVVLCCLMLSYVVLCCLMLSYVVVLCCCLMLLSYVVLCCLMLLFLLF